MKRRKKIKYIGKPPTYEEQIASFNIEPEVLAEVRQIVDEFYAKRSSRGPARRRTSPKKIHVAK